MQTETYTTKTGATRVRPVMTESEMAHAMFEGGNGFCLGCGAEADGVEPDARRYECEMCGENLVYGLEELMMMGIAKIN